MAADRYDVILVGSGQAAGPLSTALAQAGWRTALVEREYIGGTCINVGCTPTKTMVASAAMSHLAHRAAEYGVTIPSSAVDMEAVRRRKRDIVSAFRDGSTQAIRNANVEILFGEARFTSPTSVEITGSAGPRTLQSDSIVLDVGTKPSIPSIPGLEAVPYLTSTTVMELDQVPAHLICLGGGYVGTEFGQMFRRFGSAVTIVQKGAALLAREDPDISDAVVSILREDGIEILLDASTDHVSVDACGTIVLEISAGGVSTTVSGSHLLVSAGRAPNTHGLNLTAAHVETDKHGFIVVDEYLSTTQPGIYAVGDVNGGPQFTHISYDDFRILRDFLLHGQRRSTRDRLVPYTVFIDPQLGRIGLTEAEAKNSGRSIRVASMPMQRVARAYETGQTRGIMKVLVDQTTDQLLGCAILGMEGGELMAMIEIAMLGGLPYQRLRDAIFAHPTLAESFNNLFASL